MSKWVLLFLLAIFLLPAASLGQSEKPVTNDDILKMVAAGFDEETIIKAIAASETHFDTSVTALLALKRAGVSEKIIAAMLDAAARKRNTAPAAVPAPAEDPARAAPAQPEEAAHHNPPPDPNDPRSPRDPGIYWSPQEKRVGQFVLLEPVTVSQAKTKDVFKSGMTFGLAKAKGVAVVRNPQAKLRVTEPMPEFWFFFGATSGGTGESSFPESLSPEAFILAKLQSKGKNRELEVARMGTLGGSSGTRQEDTFEFDIERISKDIYRVKPRRALSPGEYCFFRPTDNMGEGMTGSKLFDFGIDPPR